MGSWWVASCRNLGQRDLRFPKRRTPKPKLMWLRRRLDEKPTSERKGCAGWGRLRRPCALQERASAPLQVYPRGVPFRTTVILSAAKDLRWAQGEIQNSRSEPAPERSEGMTTG